MASAYLSPIFNAGQQFSNQGVVLSGGKIYTYLAGTTTPLVTYTDSTAATPNANPIILDSSGRLTQEVWLKTGSSYKFILQDSTGAQVGPVYDNISGINDTVASGVSEWISTGVSPTYVSGTSFTVPGNLTTTYQPGRRVRANVTAGTVYGTIQTSVFGAVTTITMVMDSTAIDAGLSTADVGLVSATNTSEPQNPAWSYTNSTSMTAAGIVNFDSAIVAVRFGCSIASGTVTVPKKGLYWINFVPMITSSVTSNSVLFNIEVNGANNGPNFTPPIVAASNQSPGGSFIRIESLNAGDTVRIHAYGLTVNTSLATVSLFEGYFLG